MPRFLMSARETQYYLVYVTALLMGTRLGETLGPCWCDLQQDMSSLSIVQSLYERNGVCQMVQSKSKAEPVLNSRTAGAYRVPPLASGTAGS